MASARFIDGLCQRWGSPPSVILEEPVDLVMGIINILEEAGELHGEQSQGIPQDPDHDMKQSLAEMSSNRTWQATK